MRMAAKILTAYISPLKRMKTPLIYSSHIQMSHFTQGIYNLHNFIYQCVTLLPVEIRLFHEFWGKHSKDPCMGDCDVMRFIVIEIEASPQVSNFTSSSVLPWKKSNLVFSKAKVKASVQSFCFKFILGPLEPMQSAVGPSSC